MKQKEMIKSIDAFKKQVAFMIFYGVIASFVIALILGSQVTVVHDGNLINSLYIFIFFLSLTLIVLLIKIISWRKEKYFFGIKGILIQKRIGPFRSNEFIDYDNVEFAIYDEQSKHGRQKNYGNIIIHFSTEFDLLHSNVYFSGIEYLGYKNKSLDVAKIILKDLKNPKDQVEYLQKILKRK